MKTLRVTVCQCTVCVENRGTGWGRYHRRGQNGRGEVCRGRYCMLVTTPKHLITFASLTSDYGIVSRNDGQKGLCQNLRLACMIVDVIVAGSNVFVALTTCLKILVPL